MDSGDRVAGETQNKQANYDNRIVGKLITLINMSVAEMHN